MALALPQFIPLFGQVGVSGLAVAAAAGLVPGALLAALLVRGRGLGRALDALIWPLLGGGLLGARLGNQLLAPDIVLRHPQSWLTLTGTSLSFTGALLGAAVGAALGLRGLPDQSGWEALDALAPPFALAIAVGWLGLPAPGRPLALPLGATPPVHALALVGFLALSAGLAWQWKRRDYPGQNVATFVVLAGAFRFVLGFALQASPVLGPWSLTQLGDAGTVLAGLALQAWRGRAVAAP